MTFAIPKGEQGLPGETGLQGATGPQGPKGDKGDKGDTGTGYIIMGQLDSALDLPDPGSTDRQAAYLVGANEPYDLYVIVGTIGHLEWFDAGPFTTSQADINQFEAGFGLTLSEVNSKIEYAVDTMNIPTHTDVGSAINSLSSSIASVYATKASLSSFQSDVSSAFTSVYANMDSKDVQVLTDAQNFTMSAIANLSSVYAGLNSNNAFVGNNSFTKSIGLLSSANIVVTDAQQNEYAINIPRVSGTMALTSDIPSISASYSGSYWTSMTLNGVTKDFGAGGSAGATWGSITGTLSSQTDLQNALDAKVDTEVVIDEVVGESRETIGYIGNTGVDVCMGVDYGDGSDTHDKYTSVFTGTDNITIEAGQYIEDPINPGDISQYSSMIEITPDSTAINTQRLDINTDVGSGSSAGDTNVYINNDQLKLVSGNNDGTNWTSLTIGGDTYSIPAGGASYSAGDWISLSNNTISVYNPYVSLMSNNMPRILMATSTSNGAPSFASTAYVNINPENGFQVNDRRTLSTNAYTTYGHDNIKFNASHTLSFPTTSGYFVAATNLSNSAMSAETWTFTLDDDTTVTKTILVG